MQFFTKDWWSDASDRGRAVALAYSNHFASIKNNLPLTLIEFSERYELHDAEICSIVNDESAELLRMSVHRWDQNFNQRMHYCLEFSGVTKFCMSREHAPISVHSDLGEIGYWECHLESPMLKICVLFNCGAELSVSFADFKFSADPIGA